MTVKPPASIEPPAVRAGRRAVVLLPGLDILAALLLPMWITFSIAALADRAIGIWPAIVTTVVLVGYGLVRQARLAPQAAAGKEAVDRWERPVADKRWAAALKVMEDIAALGSDDPKVVETVGTLASALQEHFVTLASLRLASGQDGVLDRLMVRTDRQRRIQEQIAAEDRAIDDLIDGLRDVHLAMASLRQAERTLEIPRQLDDLLDRIEAKQEVARLPREAPPTGSQARPRPERET